MTKFKQIFRTKLILTLFSFLLAGLLIADEVKYTDSWGKQGFQLSQQKTSGVEVVYSINSFTFSSTQINGEALDVIVDENLVERAEEMGNYLMDCLSEINSPYVDHYRGKGLLVGIVLKPEAGGARRFCEALQARGVLAKETHEVVIRLAPPLVINKEELDWALRQIAEVLCEV